MTGVTPRSTSAEDWIEEDLNMGKGEKLKNGLKNIGWLVAFPAPITKKLAKRKGGKTKRKAAAIAAAWAMYLGLATAGVTSMVSPSHGGAQNTDVVQVSTDNPSGETDRNDGIVAEGQAAMECHAYYLNRYNMAEGLPREVYCVTKINGEDYRNNWVVAAGESLTIETTVIDSRTSKQLGRTQYEYTVTSGDLINGFEITSYTPIDEKTYFELDVMAVYTFLPEAQEEPAHMGELTVSVTNTGLAVGDQSIITVPGKANRDFTYSSSADSIATVSSEGVIEGIGPGRATITVTEIATGKEGYVDIHVGKPKWSTFYSYVAMEDGYLDESEWDVNTRVESKAGYEFENGDIVAEDTLYFTLQVKRKSDSAVFEKRLEHVVSTGDYEYGFIIRVYLPVTVNDPDGTEHTEYFYATFHCIYPDDTVVTDGNNTVVADVAEANNSYVIDLGQQMQLTSNRLVQGIQPLKYHLSDPAAVSVDENGLITGTGYGACAITLMYADNYAEYVTIYVAEHRDMKLTTKVVQDVGEFQKDKWDVSLYIAGQPCEDGDFYDLWQNQQLTFTAMITSKETSERSTGKIIDAPGIYSIINGYQVMVPVTVIEHHDDGTQTMTSFRVYFHFDGNLFTAENELIFGKTSIMTIDVYANGLMRTGETCQVVLQPTKAAGFSLEDEPKLVYESSDESVATIDENGTITAVGHGEAYIVVYSEETGDWGYTAVSVR